MSAARRESLARMRESHARIAEARAATRVIVAIGACPDCGAGLRQNLAITGWWQCAQSGAAGFRADAARPACPWQGFV